MYSTDTLDSILGEALAYAEQGIVCVEENDKENATTMLKMAQELISEAEKMQGVKSHELYSTALLALDKLRHHYNHTESMELKKTTPLGAPPSSSQHDHHSLDAEMLYWLPEVQLVTIEEGLTASPSPPTSLAIFAVEQPKKSDKLYPELEAAGNPKALIQVGPWIYPLNIETTAVMKNEMGVYVVPNPTTEHPNLFVGIILPPNIDKKLEDDFVMVLERYAVVRQSSIVGEMPRDEQIRTSEKIAAFLLTNGQRVAQGIKSVATKADAFTSEQGERYRSTRVPTDKPININPAIRYGVTTVYKGSKTFAKVTKYVLDKVGDVGINIGKRLSSGMSGPSGTGRLIGSSATVIGGGIAGASVVWMALEDASRQLFNSLSNESVEIIKIHYGEPASITSRQALHAAGHTTLSAFQLWDLGPRSIAGRVARKAGIQFVSGMGHKDSSTTFSTIPNEKKPLEEKPKKK